MVDINVGVVLPTVRVRDGSAWHVTAAARRAEALGFESVWAVDQLVLGTGLPVLDSLTALTAAAAVTERVRLGVGVLVLPLRPAVWVAKQVASLQLLSGDRVLLGVGVGGDRHGRSLTAVDVSRRDRGRLTDEALRVLPDLIAGKPTLLPSGAEVQLSPQATVPPIIVGGMSDAAVRRIDEHGAGWFLTSTPAEIPEQLARVRGPRPEITASAMVAVDGDPSLPDRATMVRSISDPDGLFGFPAEAAEDALISADPAGIAARLARFAEVGVQRVVVTFVAGDWFRQAELLAEACRLL